MLSAALLLVCGLAADPGRIEGRVVHSVTKEPIRRVRVVLTGGNQSGAMISSTTAEDGRFVFENLEAGSYRLMADKAGFLPASYGAKRPNTPGQPVAVGAGSSIEGIEFQLIPQGVISGRVVDEEGEPLPRASVSLLGRGVGGRMTYERMQGAMANDVGEFRIAGLNAGRYFLVATFIDGFSYREQRALRPGQVEDNYIPTWFPGALEPSGAQPIDLPAGQQMTGLSLTVRKSPVGRVRGKLLASNIERPGQGLRVNLIPRARDARGRMQIPLGGSVAADGSFEVRNVVPGAYYLAVYRMDGQAGPALRLPVDAGSGITEVGTLTVGEPLTVRGRLRWDEPTTAAFTGQIRLNQADGMGNVNGAANPAADGNFVIEKVGRDRVLVELVNLSGAYVKSIRAGSIDLLGKVFDLSQMDQVPPLDIVLSRKTARLEGVVTQDGKPVPSAFVLLVPEPARSEVGFLVRNASSDTSGRFRFGALAPGEYRVYALDQPYYVAASEPEGLKPIEAKSRRITLAEGGAETVALTLALTEAVP